MKWLDKLKETQRRNTLKRSTKMELSRMSDRGLKDIGLTRGDINRISREVTLPNLK